MSIILVAILMMAGIVGAVLVAAAIPLLFGLMAYDVATSVEISPVKAESTRARIAVERNVARGFVIAGGAFWAVASFAGLYSFQQTGLGYALLAAFLPLIACAAVLTLGWYYERLTAAVLVLASMAVVAWGVIYQFEVGVWAIMTISLIGPMLTAAVLFWLARRDQDALELSLALDVPQVAVARSARVARSDAR